jgi:hypothetical protein
MPDEPGPASQLMRAVSARYQSTIDYYMELRTTSKTSGREGRVSFDYTLAGALPNQLMMRQRSRTNDRFELVLAAGRDQGWGWQPLRKRYTRFGPEAAREREELSRTHRAFFTRFTDLDRIAVGAELRGLDDLQLEGKRVRCQRLHLAAGDGAWTEELWIDGDRHFILKLVTHRKVPFPESGETRTTVEWRTCRFGLAVAPELFAFPALPPDAQRTNGLVYR